LELLKEWNMIGGLNLKKNQARELKIRNDCNVQSSCSHIQDNRSKYLKASMHA
jgi:hypothetical protein